MKQIIPFQKELLFKTKISEITSISLEHTLSLTDEDFISGEFHISGDYKMTEGSINREKFDFKLPFDIALDSKYDINGLVIDIDNFYYEVVNNESLKVNIDVYVEGNKIEDDIKDEDREEDTIDVDDSFVEDKIDNDIQYQKPDNCYLEEDDKEDMEFHIFDQMDSSDTYVTYHVYIVKESDTIDSIISKYGVSKEDIAMYNDVDDIHVGTKLIIPNNE